MFSNDLHVRVQDLLGEEEVVSILAHHFESGRYRTWAHSQWERTTQGLLYHRIRLGGHYPDLIAVSDDQEELLAVECKGQKSGSSSREILTAFGQALAYKQASNSQAIAVPRTVWDSSYTEMAQHVGVGVFLVEDNESVATEVPQALTR